MAGRSTRPATGSNPWEIAKPDINYPVKWGGYAEHYTDEAGHDRVRRVPAHWSSRPHRSFCTPSLQPPMTRPESALK